MKTAVNTAFTVIFTLLTYLFGGWDAALAVLIAFMVIDYATGVTKAVVKKQLSSDTGFKGLAKKLFIIVILVVAVMLDRLINDSQWIFRTLVAYFYIANEGISIVENMTDLGVPVPKAVVNILEQMKNKNDGEG